MTQFQTSHNILIDNVNITNLCTCLFDVTYLLLILNKLNSIQYYQILNNTTIRGNKI